jgi:DNA-binding response OmpR family regulator
MLNDVDVLIVEDEPIIAMDIGLGVQDAGGTVIGPASSIRQALDLLHTISVSAAIVDVILSDGDILPVIVLLKERSIPVIIQSGTGPPKELSERFPDLVVFMKPVDSTELIRKLSLMLN